MEYKVEFTKAFRQNMLDIDDYISIELENPQAALRLFQKMEETVSLIGLHPMMFPADQDSEYRRVRVSPYRYTIFYRVDDHTGIVYLLRLVYSGRDFDSVL